MSIEEDKDKVQRVILSCTTLDHINITSRVASNFYLKHGYDSTTQSLSYNLSHRERLIKEGKVITLTAENFWDTDLDIIDRTLLGSEILDCVKNGSITISL